MRHVDSVLRELRARGDVWEVAAGVTGMRGDTGRLFRSIERTIAQLCDRVAEEEWRVPAAIGFETLAQADYFASFPQWLSVAGHLSDDAVLLRSIAEHPLPGIAARRAALPPTAALSPAVCYHVYSALAGTTIAAPRIVTAQSTCWRHEGTRHASLEREWAFTMRELVCIGSHDEVRRFTSALAIDISAFAQSIGLSPELVVATDPFFAPTARAKQLMQRVGELKRELMLPLTMDRGIAAASFNMHDTFFGDAFGIRLGNGTPASTGCVAFGIERWTLAFLVQHGTVAAHWPSLPEVHTDGVPA